MQDQLNRIEENQGYMIKLLEHLVENQPVPGQSNVNAQKMMETLKITLAKNPIIASNPAIMSMFDGMFGGE